MPGRVVAADVYLPHGLRWHADALWFTDTFGGTVCRIGSSCDVVARVPGRPGGLGWTRDGLLLVVAMERRSIMSATPGGCLDLYADLSRQLPTLANDMIVDPVGRAYVGSLGVDHERRDEFVPSRLVRVDPDGSTHLEGPELLAPHGAVLVDAGQTMIVAETLGDRLTELRVAPDGHLHDPRVLVELPAGSGPAGIAVDAGGRIWAACGSAGRVVAVTRCGRIEAQIDVPGEGVYDVAVGGERGRTLFLVIASLDLDIAARTPTGRIEAYEP